VEADAAGCNFLPHSYLLFLSFCLILRPTPSSFDPQVTGAPSLPVVGAALGSSSPLEGKDLVLLVLVLSRDGQTGFAVASGVHPGANMEQWHLLVNLGRHSMQKSKQKLIILLYCYVQ
jgi:hypothetical protein